MPELPEVHTIASDLKKHIIGFRITEVDIVNNYRVEPDAKTFKKALLQQTITDVHRVAKNILIQLESGDYFRVHLAMTGQVFLRSEKDIVPRWTRVLLRLSRNTDTKTIFFTDMRMFGKHAIISAEEVILLKKRYGPEPIPQSDITYEEFHKRITSKRTNIKNVLLDQSIISGLGNIYATDALFLAKVHPETLANKLNPDTTKKLLDAAKQVLSEGIENRGSTLSDKMYLDIFGKEGFHQNHFKIYGKTECPVCKTKVEYKKISARGTYFCPNCQQLKND